MMASLRVLAEQSLTMSCVGFDGDYDVRAKMNEKFEFGRWSSAGGRYIGRHISFDAEAYHVSQREDIEKLACLPLKRGEDPARACMPEEATQWSGVSSGLVR